MTLPPYPLNPEPMEKSWLELNPRWKIPLGFVILLVLMAALAIVLATIVSASFHSSDVYKLALASAVHHPQVRDLIGEPIKPGWLISGQLKINGRTGEANFFIPISGPRGRGTIHVVAYKDGVWHFTSLQVSPEGNSATENIDLLSTPPPPSREF
jgi:Cytochrome oxidase complex assembly protein 1